MQRFILRRGSTWFLGNMRITYGSAYPLEGDWEMAIYRTMSGFDKLRNDLAVRSKSGAAFGCIIDHDTCVLITEIGTASIEEPTKVNIQIAREALEALTARRPAAHVILSVLHEGDTLEDFQFHASPRCAETNNFTDGIFRRHGTSRRRIVMSCKEATYLVRVQRNDNHEIQWVEIFVQQRFDRKKLAGTLTHLV
jgi:hypothetical protein